MTEPFKEFVQYTKRLEDIADKTVTAFKDMTNEAYHDHDALSRSDALTIKRAGPGVARYRKDNPVHRTSPALEFGSIFHRAMEDISEFQRIYQPEPEMDRRTKAYKETMAVLREDNPNSEFIKQSDYDLVLNMHRVIMDHPTLIELLLGEETIPELSLFGTYEDAIVKARPDLIIPGRGVMLDWKTCQDASADGFAKSVRSFGYWLQPCWYATLVNRYFGEPFRLIFVCVEKDPPHAVALYELDRAWHLYAAQVMREVCIKWAGACASGEFPMLPERIQTIQAPEYIRESFGALL